MLWRGPLTYGTVFPRFVVARRFGVIDSQLLAWLPEVGQCTSQLLYGSPSSQLLGPHLSLEAHH